MAEMVGAYATIGTREGNTCERRRWRYTSQLECWESRSALSHSTQRREPGCIARAASCSFTRCSRWRCLARGCRPSRGRARTSNIPVGLLTAYLVTTALLTVSPPASGSRWKDVGLMLVALAVCLSLFTFGVEAASSPNGQLNGIPVPPFFIFGLIALLASVGDLRLIRSGGVRTVRGRPRLVRHLWRMCTALLIAAFSFFLGQSQVFPKPIRIVPLLALPPLAALVTMVYWLSRVRGRRFSVHAVMGAPAALSDYPV